MKGGRGEGASGTPQLTALETSQPVEYPYLTAIPFILTSAFTASLYPPVR